MAGRDALDRVTVNRDHKIRAAGRRLDDVIVYDWGFDLHGRSYEQRSYLLLDDGFQINQPVIFPEAQQGWWYCDLVRITDDGNEVLVEDLWIDVMVGPPDHPYRVLDLDEYAEAAARGELSAAEAADGLIRTQRFLDRRLNRRHETQRTWPDFPPQTVTTLANATFEAAWSPLSPGSE
jgi:predicted RNA-binding protein associated with RNAse of E/G family